MYRIIFLHMYYDIHSHLNLKPLSKNFEEVVKRMREAKTKTITVGVDLETSQRALEIALQNEDIWATVGLHPTDNENEMFNAETYKELGKHPKVVAIGECGLDYYRKNDEETKRKQKDLFLEHIHLAIELQKPLMIHARPKEGTMDAYEDVLSILEEKKKMYEELSGNFHFFVGNLEIARRVFALGFSVSFDGPITFTSEYDEVIAFAPIDKIHAETDAPFAAPHPYRGKTNEPAYVIEIIKKIAKIKKLPLAELAGELHKNFKKTFRVE